MPLKPIKIRLGGLNRFLNGTTGLDVIAASTPYTFQPKQRIAPVQNQTTTDFQDQTPEPAPDANKRGRSALSYRQRRQLEDLICVALQNDGKLAEDGFVDYRPGLNDIVVARDASTALGFKVTPGNVAGMRVEMFGNLRKSTPLANAVSDVDSLKEMATKLTLTVATLNELAIKQADMIHDLCARLAKIEAFLGDDL